MAPGTSLPPPVDPALIATLLTFLSLPPATSIAPLEANAAFHRIYLIDYASPPPLELQDLRRSPGGGTLGPYASHADFVKGFVGELVHAICVRERLGWVRDLVPRLAALAGALPRLRLDTKMVLAHKDLHFGNVMVDEDGELTAVLDWEFAGVVPVVRWDPVRAFLWNGVYSQEGHDEKYRMRAVFERELERRGVDKWWEATNADVDAVWDVVRYVRAIVELCPRGDKMDLCRVWRAKAEEALAKLGV